MCPPVPDGHIELHLLAERLIKTCIRWNKISAWHWFRPEVQGKLYGCNLFPRARQWVPVSLPVNSTLLRKQAEFRSTSTLLFVNKVRLYSSSWLYKHRCAVAAHAAVKTFPSHMCLLISCVQAISLSFYSFPSLQSLHLFKWIMNHWVILKHLRQGVLMS